MAGRGRGRGMSFKPELLGFGRGESLPPPSVGPPHLYPPLDFLPIPLECSERENYLLALKQELRGTMKDSRYFIKPVEQKKDIVRYSDKYHSSGHNGDDDDINSWVDWKRLPTELKPKRRKKINKSSLKPKVKIDIDKTLQDLEKMETTKTDQDDKDEEDEDAEKKNEEKSGDEEEEYYDEEEQEEGTDYIMSYFDNGENYLDEEDENLDDGPVY